MGHFRPRKRQLGTSPLPADEPEKGYGALQVSEASNRSAASWNKPRPRVTSPTRANGAHEAQQKPLEQAQTQHNEPEKAQRPKEQTPTGVRSERGATRRDEGRRRGKATHHAGQRAERQEEAKSAATSAMQGRGKKQNNGKLTQTRSRSKPRGADREKGEWHSHLRAAVEGRVQGAHPGLNPVSAASGVPAPREGPPTEQRRNPEGWS